MEQIQEDKDKAAALSPKAANEKEAANARMLSVSTIY
jgi:hypothetical protein